MNDVTLSGVVVSAPSARDMRFSGLIWGPAGSGKTTLASTAPGIKLHMCFDPDGEMSLADRSDVLTMAFYQYNPLTVVGEFKKSDPYGITGFLQEHEEVETVILDSMTVYAHYALLEAVQRAGGAKVTLQQPGMNGYSYRNSLVLQAASTMLGITAKLRRNIIFTTHEGAPDVEDDGNITMILSTNLANQIGLRINEVWHLADLNGTSRVISVRPHTRMKPMKTRMFRADHLVKFNWYYNANTNTGEGIADWWHAWKENSGNKIDLPSIPRATASKGGAKK